PRHPGGATGRPLASHRRTPGRRPAVGALLAGGRGLACPVSPVCRERPVAGRAAENGPRRTVVGILLPCRDTNSVAVPAATRSRSHVPWLRPAIRPGARRVTTTRSSCCPPLP